MDERDWGRLVDQIGSGDCTPFVGAGACTGVLPTAATLSEYWAGRYHYPFADSRTWLADVMEYATITEQDPVTVKRRVADHLATFGEPDFTAPLQLHSLLARLPLTTYLTTNYDDFMAGALRVARRSPRVAICPWYRGAPDALEFVDADWQPSVDEPLVYHLHGAMARPESIVISERDYTEFLVNLAMDKGMDQKRVVPHQVLPALTQRPLLFVGYSLRDASFRTLFHGLVQTVASVQRRRHVSVQLEPIADHYDPSVRARAKAYLQEYFGDLNISVYWGTVSAFASQLALRLGTG